MPQIFQNYSEPLRLLDLEADFISLSPDPSRSLSDPLDLDLDLDLERSFSSLLNDDKQYKSFLYKLLAVTWYRRHCLSWPTRSDCDSSKQTSTEQTCSCCVYSQIFPSCSLSGSWTLTGIDFGIFSSSCNIESYIYFVAEYKPIAWSHQ